MSTDVPDIVVGRLPLYLRVLNRLLAQDQEVTSSQELGEELGISSAQIRKDLSHFGEFGKQGTGYHVSFLVEQLNRILNLEKEWTVALVGIGDLGRALVGYAGFQPRGFRITHIFDNSPAKIGQVVDGVTIQPLDDLPQVVPQAKIQVAMVAVPAPSAQEVADTLVKAGIKAILNYAPTKLRTPQNVHVQDIDPVIHLQHMTFYLSTKK